MDDYLKLLINNHSNFANDIANTYFVQNYDEQIFTYFRIYFFLFGMDFCMFNMYFWFFNYIYIIN